MDDRIIKLLRKVTSNSNEIEDVHKDSNEFYFRYKTHIFSLLHSANRAEEYGPYSFYIYPKFSHLGIGSVIERSNEGDLDDSDMAHFHCAQYDKRDWHVFEELYQKLKNIYSNVDALIDDLLNDLE